MGKKLTAEFLGTFWLVFGNCGSAVAAAFLNVGIGLMRVAFAFGLTLLTMIYTIGPNHGAIGYPKWRIDRVFLLVPAQQYVATFLASF